MTVGGQPVLNGHIPAPEAFLCGPSQLAPVDGQGMYRLVVILNRFLGFIATIIERSFIYQFNSTTLFALNSFSMSMEEGTNKNQRKLSQFTKFPHSTALGDNEHKPSVELLQVGGPLATLWLTGFRIGSKSAGHTHGLG